MLDGQDTPDTAPDELVEVRDRIKAARRAIDRMLAAGGDAAALRVLAARLVRMDAEVAGAERAFREPAAEVRV
jgi:hypothetical protein